MTLAEALDFLTAIKVAYPRYYFDEATARHWYKHLHPYPIALCHRALDLHCQESHFPPDVASIFPKLKSWSRAGSSSRSDDEDTVILWNTKKRMAEEGECFVRIEEKGSRVILTRWKISDCVRVGTEYFRGESLPVYKPIIDWLIDTCGPAFVHEEILACTDGRSLTSLVSRPGWCEAYREAIGALVESALESRVGG